MNVNVCSNGVYCPTATTGDVVDSISTTKLYVDVSLKCLVNTAIASDNVSVIFSRLLTWTSFFKQQECFQLFLVIQLSFM